MSRDIRILRTGAIASLIALLLLLVMAVMPWPFHFSIPGEEILAGKVVLASADFLRYENNVVLRYLIIDDIFVFSWIVMWIAMVVFVRRYDILVANVLLMLSMVGAIFDLAENEIIFALIKQFHLRIISLDNWLILWRIIRQLSYLFPFLAAILLLINLWSQKILNATICVAGILFVVVAVIGVYVPSLYALTYIWYLLWSILGSVFLWNQSQATEALKQN